MDEQPDDGRLRPYRIWMDAAATLRAFAKGSRGSHGDVKQIRDRARFYERAAVAYLLRIEAIEGRWRGGRRV